MPTTYGPDVARLVCRLAASATCFEGLKSLAWLGWCSLLRSLSSYHLALRDGFWGLLRIDRLVKRLVLDASLLKDRPRLVFSCDCSGSSFPGLAVCMVASLGLNIFACMADRAEDMDQQHCVDVASWVWYLVL